MKLLGQVLKSQSDKRIYRAISLKNQIQCLLVSDCQAEKSSAALSVGVGSLKDPQEAQGLAHYLQHMLFMGTEKYPEENQYMSFVTKNNGMTNAYTSQEQTNFHFEVASPALSQTLDRFAQFFISPLMLESSSDRQLNAVHSEHSKNLQSDMWKTFQITKYIAKEGHPFRKFSTGDKNSLNNPNLRKMLMDFYQQNYSSNLMNLVVCGKQSIQQLQDIVQDKFTKIKNKNYKSYQMMQIPFNEKALGKIIKVFPVLDKMKLQLTWILQNKSKNYKNSPATYVGHLLGHQGKGSLLSFLIQQGLVTQLSAGGSDSYNLYSQFQINLILTQKGLTSINQIISYILYSIQLLKKNGPQKWVFEEIKKINRIRFDYMQKKKGMNYVSSIAKKIHKKPIEQILSYPYFMDQWQPQVIEQYIAQLKLDNLIVFAHAQQFQNQCNEIQPIYQTKFNISPLGVIQSLQCKIELPQANQFIPNDLTVLPLQQQTLPILLDKSDAMEAYFKPDHSFSLPKTILYLRIYFQGQNTVKQQIVRELFQEMMKQFLREYSYQGQVAQLCSKIDFPAYYYLDIEIDGFRDSFNKFISFFLNRILKFIPDDQSLFATLKDKKTKQYQNYYLNNPYQLAYNTLLMSVRQGNSNSPLLKKNAINDIKFEDIVQYSKNWHRKCYSQIYIGGNMSLQHAKLMTNEINKLIQYNSACLSLQCIGSIRPIFLPLQKTIIIEQQLENSEQTNNALIVHFQHQQMKVRSKIFQDLLMNFVKQPAFDYLRTKQQLGYIVMCLPDDHRGIMGFSLLVQSNIKNTYELVQYCDTFFKQILSNCIKSLTMQQFQDYKKSLLISKSQKDESLPVESRRFWKQIVKHSYQFTRQQQEIQIIPGINLQQFKKFINYLIYQQIRRLEVHQMTPLSKQSCDLLRKKRIQGNSHQFQIYHNAEALKKKMCLYPDYYSHL